MRRLILSRLIWIYVVCKSLLFSPVAVKELKYKQKQAHERTHIKTKTVRSLLFCLMILYIDLWEDNFK